MYFVECQMVTLGKICFTECLPGRHSAKKCEVIFAECPLADTRQRILYRVSPIWHSAKLILKIKKKYLPSARSRALGKEGKIYFRPAPFFFFLSSLSLFLSAVRRRAKPPPCCAASPPPHRRAASPPRRLTAARPRAAAPPHRRRAHAPPHRRPPTRRRPPARLRRPRLRYVIEEWINCVYGYGYGYGSSSFHYK
jgi:hypothetical protein